MRPYLTPPFRFAPVEHDIYRGAYPTLLNLRFLRRLNLKTIISLTPEPPVSHLVEFTTQNSITLFHFPVTQPKDDVTMAPELVAKVLSLLIAPRHHPLFIHCLDGASVTGVVIMCLRKLQHWNLARVVFEQVRFSREFSVSTQESEFVETFRGAGGVRVPSSLPKWLWSGQHIKHPTIRLIVPEEVRLASQEAPRTVVESQEEFFQADTARWLDALDLHGYSGPRGSPRPRQSSFHKDV